MTARQACLATVFGVAIGFTAMTAPVQAQTANESSTTRGQMVQPGAMGSGTPGGNPSAAGGPSERTQGVPGQPGIASQPAMERQGQNQLGLEQNRSTQGITLQPGAPNQGGALTAPGAQQSSQGGQPTGPGQTGTSRDQVNIAPNGADPTAGATAPAQPAQGSGERRDATPPAVTTQHTEPRTAAAPVAGANSFTENQARARMADAGFNDVQSLQLDNQGIWRGRAIRNGQPTGVALDFQGNVTAQ